MTGVVKRDRSNISMRFQVDRIVDEGLKREVGGGVEVV